MTIESSFRELRDRLGMTPSARWTITADAAGYEAAMRYVESHGFVRSEAPDLVTWKLTEDNVDSSVVYTIVTAVNTSRVGCYYMAAILTKVQ